MKILLKRLHGGEGGMLLLARARATMSRSLRLLAHLRGDDNLVTVKHQNRELKRRGGPQRDDYGRVAP